MNFTSFQYWLLCMKEEPINPFIIAPLWCYYVLLLQYYELCTVYLYCNETNIKKASLHFFRGCEAKGQSNIELNNVGS